MNMPFTQDTRIAKLFTVLGKDKLVLLRLDGTDYVDDLFEYRIEALTTTPDVDFDELVGTQARVEMETLGHGYRYFNGFVTDARWTGVGENGSTYQFTMRPWLWFLSLRRNQRIFHNKTVVNIIEEIFADYQDVASDLYELKLTKSYETLEYTVQYNESDLDFVRRQMERFGISFFFEYSEDGHKLILVDAIDRFGKLPDNSREYIPVNAQHRASDEHFWEWQPGRKVTTGAIRLTDFNFKFPNQKMKVDDIGNAKFKNGKIQSYDYPGDYLQQNIGKNVSKLRTIQERGQDDRQTAVGDVMSLSAGMRFTLTGQQTEVVKGKEYLCLKASHSFKSESFGTVSENRDDGHAFTGRYETTQTNAVYGPKLKTPRPIVHGPQTATVVGEGEIDCDEFGRILVQFHWDLDGDYSMRCRVSQNWASKGWGGMIIPRIDMEVVVEFLEGDPDKPLVTGCVYNGANDPPYPLPQNKTKSVFKTDTHQGSGFNELMFEDEKDEELIYMHGQKDQQIEILNDRTKTIGRDEANTIGRDRSQDVARDETMNVGQDQRETIGRDVIYEVGRNQQEKYGKDHVHYVGNIHKQDIYADHIVNIGADHEMTVMGKSVLNVTKSITNNTKTHTLMAYDKMIMKGPGGKITIDASGIKLEAAMIKLKGSVQMGGMGSAQVPTLKGAANDKLPLVEECLKQKGEEDA